MRITLRLITRGIVLFVLGWFAVLAGSLVNAQDITRESARSDPLREISPQNGSERHSPRFTGVSGESTQSPTCWPCARNSAAFFTEVRFSPRS